MDLDQLDVGLLALFVGLAANDEVTRAVPDDLRFSHGFLFQHLVEGPRTVAELARRQGVSKQAVGKVVAELRAAGYLEEVPGDDARTRPVALSAQGRAAVTAARRGRAALARRLDRRFGAERRAGLRADLAAVLEELGGADDVRARRVRLPA